MASGPPSMFRRNGENRSAPEEFCVLRRYKLKRGMHTAFVEASRSGGMWDVYTKIGARMVGDFKIVYPAPGETGPADYDESYRLARYVDFDHWKDTRRPARMIGTGPLSAGAGASGSTRRGYQTDDGDGLGAVYLRGNMAPDRPYHMPARGMEDEEFEPMEDTDTAEPDAIEYGPPLPGDEIVEMMRYRITKGSAGGFRSLSEAHIWPLYQAMGARPIGQWVTIYPEEANGGDYIGDPDGDYDEVVEMTRYASYQHWEAAQSPTYLVGSGPNYQAYTAAVAEQKGMIQSLERVFMQGELYPTPPTFVPPVSRHRLRL